MNVLNTCLQMNINLAQLPSINNTVKVVRSFISGNEGSDHLRMVQIMIKQDNSSSVGEMINTINKSSFGSFLYDFKLILILVTLLVITGLLYKLVKRKEHDWSENPEILALSTLSRELLFKFDLKTNTLDFVDKDSKKIASNISWECKNLKETIINHLKTTSNDGVTTLKHHENNQVLHMKIYHLRPEKDTRWIIGKIIDVDDEVKQQEQLIKQARTDGLTQLYNASHAKEMIQYYLGVKELEQKDALIIVDLNDFKLINDTYGHLEGDRILQEVAQTIKNTFSDASVIGRYGGDEFIIYLQDVDFDDINCPAIETFTRNLGMIDFPLTITCSLGLSIVSHQKDFETIFIEADMALYSTKKSGA